MKSIGKIFDVYGVYYIESPYTSFGYHILASALKELSKKGYTHYSIFDKVKIIPKCYVNR